MKTTTLTALVALLVAIPLVLKAKKFHLAGLAPAEGCLFLTDENLRYAIDDLPT